jgi:hypothetical protein
MVLSLEQNSGPDRRHHADVDDRQQDPAASAPPYLLDLAPEAYFFFLGVKEVLAGAVLTLESFKKIWGGVGRNIDIDQFATAFSRGLDCCNKCIWLNNGLTKKSSEINILLTITLLFLFMFFNLILYAPRISLNSFMLEDGT